MLVITGNGWLLRSPGFIAKTSKGIWRCCHHQLPIYQGHHRPWAKPCNKRRAAAGDLAHIRKTKSRYCFSLVLTGIEKFPQKLHNWLHTLHYTAYAIGLCPSCLTWSFPQLYPNALKNKKKITQRRKKFPGFPWKSSTKGWGCSCSLKLSTKQPDQEKKPKVVLQKEDEKRQHSIGLVWHV